MGDTSDKAVQNTRDIAQLLDDHRAIGTVALDVREICTFADFFVIATVTSQGHLRGLITRLDELFDDHGIVPLNPLRRSSEAGWVLIDLGYAVIHLMTEEMREFYELERLWFGATRVFSSESP